METLQDRLNEHQILSVPEQERIKYKIELYSTLLNNSLYQQFHEARDYDL